MVANTRSDHLAARTTPADPGVFAGYPPSLVLTDQLIKGVALALLGFNHEPPGLYRKRYGSVWTERKGIEHLPGNRKHNGAANFSKLCAPLHEPPGIISKSIRMSRLGKVGLQC